MIKEVAYIFKDHASASLFRDEIRRDCGLHLQSFATDDGHSAVYITEGIHFFDDKQFEVIEEIARKYK